MSDLIERQAVLSLPRNTKRTLFGKIVRQSIDVNLIEKLPPVEQWISIKDAMPEKNKTVIIAHIKGASFGLYNGRYFTRGYVNKYRQIKTVTHWMPLPEPPRKEKRKK